MSSSEENKLQEVDVENFDFNNDAFVKSYGTAAVQDANERTERMVKSMNDKKKPSIGFVNKGLEVDTNARLSQFSKETVYEGDWTASTLNLLEAWFKQCKDSAAAYAAAARSARTKHRMITIPTIIAGTAATALSFFNAGDTCDPDTEENNGLKYSVALLTSTVSVLGGISALYSFKSKVDACINAAGNFENLARRCSLQIFLPNSLRAHSELVLTEVSIEFGSLTMNSPLL